MAIPKTKVPTILKTCTVIAHAMYVVNQTEERCHWFAADWEKKTRKGLIILSERSTILWFPQSDDITKIHFSPKLIEIVNLNWKLIKM